MRLSGAVTMPNDLSPVRYEIHAERDGRQVLLWHETIPPFCSVVGQAGWWGDRLVSVADLAGQQVTLRFSAKHTDGRADPPLALGGFDRVALLNLGTAE